jgi:hypothetical protein
MNDRPLVVKGKKLYPLSHTPQLCRFGNTSRVAAQHGFAASPRKIKGFASCTHAQKVRFATALHLSIQKIHTP